MNQLDMFHVETQPSQQNPVNPFPVLVVCQPYHARVSTGCCVERWTRANKRKIAGLRRGQIVRDSTIANQLAGCVGCKAGEKRSEGIVQEARQ